MADDLKYRVDVSADVAGKREVDGLAQSVDSLGAGARQAGTDAKAAGGGIDAIGNAAQRTEVKATQANRKIADSVAEIGNQIDLLTKAWIALSGGSFLVGTAASIGQVADEFAGLRARMQLVVGEGPALEQAMAGVQSIALSTGSALAETGKLFTRIAEAGKTLGIGMAESLAITETISQSIQISGESAEASKAAIQQLVQGLQSGVLRGEEFNSVMEQAPRLAQALAAGLGVTTGELRKLAEAGALSSASVIGALQGQAKTIQAEFAQLPPTIGRALESLKTNFAAYIGEVDASSGASAKAASAIKLVGENLELISGALINSGQAWLAWRAYNIAAEFLGLRGAVLASAAAKATDTAATAANTAATAGNTLAQKANAAARGAAVAGTAELAGATGKLAAAFSLIKGFSFAFLLTNLQDIGGWLAKTAYGFTDLAKRTAEQERESQRLAAATKAEAAEMAELATKKRLAAEAALGLSARSKVLVADFEEAVKSGSKASEAIGKLAKALDLSDIQGIADAGAALDALAVKGKASADQVRDAWKQALASKDLRTFEVEAAAAFDNSEQGARRLAAAMDAVLAEALRRTGKDMAELSTGISTGAQTAINSYDVLVERLEDVRAKGLDVGTTLAASLEQATNAANSEAALGAVIERWDELGRQGLLTGERLRRGLDGAHDKLDNLAPGINSVTEAFRTLGLRSQAELKRTADTARQAFDTIRDSGTATPAQLAAAWRRYAETVLEANGGVVTDALRIEASMRGMTIEVDNAGKAIIASMGGGTRETERFADAAGKAVEKVRELKDVADRPSPRFEGTISGEVDRRGRGFSGDINVRDSSKERTVQELKDANFTESEIQNYYSDRRTSESDKAAGNVSRSVNTQQINAEFLARSKGLSGPAVKAFVDAFGDNFAQEMAGMAQRYAFRGPLSAEEYIKAYSGSLERAVDQSVNDAKSTVGKAKRAEVGASDNPASTHRVEITLNGKTTAVDTASPNAAQALIGMLTDLSKRAA